MILAGDVGGTKTRLGLFRSAGGALELVRTERYVSADHAGLADVLRRFLAEDERGRVAAACFGVAGPVFEDESRATNLPWEISGPRLAAELDLPAVRLINDLVATGEGIPALSPDDLASLQDGVPEPDGNGVLVAAGTGLGVALLPRVGGELRPSASEGGHADFAPRDELEESLRRFLARRVGGRVSVERVVSGPGIAAIHEHLRERGAAPEDPDVRDRIAAGDPARAISEAALEGSCALSALAMRAFVSAYGAVAGNLALVGLASAGVWIGGGIAPKILPLLRAGDFLEAFRAKGRFRELLERVPVRVILRPETALLGAARRAAREADGR